MLSAYRLLPLDVVGASAAGVSTPTAEPPGSLVVMGQGTLTTDHGAAADASGAIPTGRLASLIDVLAVGVTHGCCCVRVNDLKVWRCLERYNYSVSHEYCCLLQYIERTQQIIKEQFPFFPKQRLSNSKLRPSRSSSRIFCLLSICNSILLSLVTFHCIPLYPDR